MGMGCLSFQRKIKFFFHTVIIILSLKFHSTAICDKSKKKYAMCCGLPCEFARLDDTFSRVEK